MIVYVAKVAEPACRQRQVGRLQYNKKVIIIYTARMAELVDAHDSKSCSERGAGSIPVPGTK